MLAFETNKKRATQGGGFSSVAKKWTLFILRRFSRPKDAAIYQELFLKPSRFVP